MLKNLIRSTILSAVKEKLLTTYGSVIYQNFGNVSSLIGAYRDRITGTTSTSSSSRYKRQSSSFVKHNKNGGYFHIDTRDCRAQLHYEIAGDVVRIVDTDVPKKCSGRGYGKQLANAALTWVAQNNYRVIIECDFVSDYIKRYRPDFQKYVKN